MSKTETMAFRVAPEVKAAVQKKAGEMGVSVSVLLEATVELMLKTAWNTKRS